MSSIDRTGSVYIRFTLVWSYSGVLGYCLRLVYPVFQYLLRLKLDRSLTTLSQETRGIVRVRIVDRIHDHSIDGGYILEIEGDSWFMGKFVRPILNETNDRRIAAIERILTTDLGDLVEGLPGISTSISVLDYSLGRPLNPPTRAYV